MDRIEIKASITVDEAGEITGTAWLFGSPDRVGDVIEKGAFTAPARLPMLYGHDPLQPIGVWDSIVENDNGLIVKGRLLVEDVARAREVRALVREGAVNGLSIGFVTRKSSPRRGAGRTITALDLHEISIVPVPAHPGARITTIKSEGSPMPENAEAAPEIAALETKIGEVADTVKGLNGLGARMDKIEARLNRPSPANDNPDAHGDVERKALVSYVRTGSDVEIKAAATDNNPDGGWFVLPTIDTSIRTLAAEISPMRRLAEVATISTSTLERFYSLGVDGATWVTERDDRPQDTARPELIKHAYGVSELYAAPAATRHMLEDAAIDVAGWLINDATRKFAKTEGIAFMRGDGVAGRPRGLLDYGTTSEADFTRAWGKHQYIPAGHASAPTDDNLARSLVALMMTLGEQYRGNARWLMNRTTAIRVRQLQDTAKRFLWAPTGNLVEGEQGTLLGYPVEYDAQMDDIGENKHPIAFGDFAQGYVIVDRHGIRIERDAVTQKGRVLFDTYKRVGGGASDFNAIKFLKVAAT